MWVLWGKSWLWDIKHCWYNYPHHSVEKDVWWYYMVELSFYWSLCISQVSTMKLLSYPLYVNVFSYEKKNLLFTDAFLSLHIDGPLEISLNSNFCYSF